MSLMARRSRAAQAFSCASDHSAQFRSSLSTSNVLAPISDEFEKIIATQGTSYLIVSDGKHPDDTAIYLDAVTLYGIRFTADSPEVYQYK